MVTPVTPGTNAHLVGDTKVLESGACFNVAFGSFILSVVNATYDSHHELEASNATQTRIGSSLS